MNHEQEALKAAYAYCKHYTKQHTEHFPVRSFVLPKALCRAIEVVYAFARQADDLADENDTSPLERITQLESYEAALRSLSTPSLRGHSDPKQSSQKSAVSGLPRYARNDDECKHLQDPVFIALRDLLQHYPLLDKALLFDLLDAFKQDVIKNHYQNKAEILDYCRRSANPVGRLLLHLSGQATPFTLQASDALCTALQLINFIHDIHPDFVERARCYMPDDTLQSMGLSADMIAAEKPPSAVHHFVQAQLDEIESLLTEGARLSAPLSGRFGFYTEMVIQSAYQIMHKLRLRSDLHQRLHFSITDWILIVCRTIVRRFKAC